MGKTKKWGKRGEVNLGGFPWIERVLRLAEGVDPEMVPTQGDPPQKGDHVVGTATNALKRLFGVAILMDRQSYELQGKARFCRDQEERRLFSLQALEATIRKECAMDLLFGELREAFDLWNVHTVAVRNNWEVVWTNTPREEEGEEKEEEEE